MNAILRHLVVLPIVVPLIAGAAMFFLAEARRTARVTLAVVSVLIQLAVAVRASLSDERCRALHLGRRRGCLRDRRMAGTVWHRARGRSPVRRHADARGHRGAGDARLFSCAAGIVPGQPFHSLFQFLTMGLNGAFLTGDLFNLFVFFEVLLAASYGLLLRGGGAPRVKLALHYIAVNLTASFLFLIGVALIYGVAGTLNMADLAGRAAALAPDDRALLDAGAAILGIAFLVKAGKLATQLLVARRLFDCARARGGQSFAMMTKVGLYAVLRLGTLMQEYETLGRRVVLHRACNPPHRHDRHARGKASRPRWSPIRFWCRWAFCLRAWAFASKRSPRPVLFYLIVSVLTTCTFFMLTGMTDRTRVTDPPASPEDRRGRNP